MRKLLLFFAMLSVSIGAWAGVTISPDGDDGVIIECDNFGDFNSWNQQNPKPEADLELLARLNSAGKLTLKGKYNSNDLSVFQNQWNKSTTVDFWDAEFDTFEKTGGYWDAEQGQYITTTTTFSCQTFKYWSDATTIVMSDKETNTFDKESMFGNFNGGKPAVENVTVAGAIDVPKDLFGSRNSLKSVTFSSKVTGIGEAAFKGCQYLESVNFGNDCHITTIGKEAFDQAGQSVKDENNQTVAFPKGSNGRLEIPNSVVTIEQAAFQECPIKTLVINEGSQLESIGSKAFFYEQGPLNEVYVNKTDATIACAVDAFDDTHTDGHTDVATAKTRLYYPAEWFDHYVGDWKEPAFHGIINQANLQTLDDIVKQGKVIDGVQYGPTNNGWHMFVSSGIAFTEKTTWRTYSTVVSFKVPETDNVKTYLVCGYNKNGQVELVQMNEDETIPANTGVLFHYVRPGENATFSSVVPIDKVDTDQDRYDDQLFPDNKYQKNGKSYANYLRKINRESIRIDNVCKEDGVTYRNFFLSEGKQLDAATQYQGEDYKPGTVSGWGFFRAVSMQYPTVNNKAYLHLPGNLCPSDANYGTVDDSNATNAKSFGMIIIDGDELGENGGVTNIQNTVSELSGNDNGYYTLQGMQVSNPSKGIYIHNGKKIIVR